VVEFDAGKIAGVAGDVGDHEAGAFRLGQHGYFPYDFCIKGMMPEQNRRQFRPF